MDEDIFESFIKEKLPRQDDKKLFEELYEIYRKRGKESLTKHIRDIITLLEG